MSADNYVAIITGQDGIYRGYMLLASEFDDVMPEVDAIVERHRPLWEVSTVEEAIKKAQQEYTEYGYYFVNL